MAAPYSGDQHLVADQRLDGSSIDGATYAHTTFANVSFKDCRISHGLFRNCVFIECYFRATHMESTQFIGCKFINCNFTRLAVSGCNWRYVEFRDCFIPYGQMRYNLPGEANVRGPLAANLAREADRAGDDREAGRYRLVAVAAREAHLWSAFKHEDKYYQDHFPGISRYVAGLDLLRLHFLGLLWKHGESARRLLTNAAICVFGVFPVAYWLWRGQLTAATNHVTFGDVEWLSVGTFLPVSSITSVHFDGTAVRVVAALEALAGLVVAGLLVSRLLRLLIRR